MSTDNLQIVPANDNPIDTMKNEIQKAIVGYDDIILKILYSLFGDFNVLLQSVPGLSKTLMLKALSRVIDGATHSRIQGTPDLLPSDIVGCQILNRLTQKFETVKGPIFANVVLADEINRMPPKTQSALLQAMQEHEVTIAGETFSLPQPFITTGTMNPIEQEGTYPLPEAQLDRFGLQLTFSYLNRDDERRLTANHRALREVDPSLVCQPVVSTAEILAYREAVLNEVYCAPALYDYVTDLVRATRPDDKEGFLRGAPAAQVDQYRDLVRFGCSPRSSFSLVGVCQVRAFHQGRDYVVPEDVKWVAKDVLCHRMGLTPQAQMSNMNTSQVIDLVLKNLPIVDGDWKRPSATK